MIIVTIERPLQESWKKILFNMMLSKRPWNDLILLKIKFESIHTWTWKYHYMLVKNGHFMDSLFMSKNKLQISCGFKIPLFLDWLIQSIFFYSKKIFVNFLLLKIFHLGKLMIYYLFNNLKILKIQWVKINLAKIYLFFNFDYMPIISIYCTSLLNKLHPTCKDLLL